MTVIFEAGWSTHEEYAHVRIYEQDGRYFERCRGHNVYQGDYRIRREVTQDEALETMLDMADCEDEPEILATCCGSVV